MPSHIVTLTTRNTRLIDKIDHLFNKKLIIHSSEMILKHCKIKSYIEELTLAKGNNICSSFADNPLFKFCCIKFT